MLIGYYNSAIRIEGRLGLSVIGELAKQWITEEKWRIIAGRRCCTAR
jgi:hypothetical protein